jgi:hypothetical protein
LYMHIYIYMCMYVYIYTYIYIYIYVSITEEKNTSGSSISSPKTPVPQRDSESSPGKRGDDSSVVVKDTTIIKKNDTNDMTLDPEMSQKNELYRRIEEICTEVYISVYIYVYMYLYVCVCTLCICVCIYLCK